MYPCQRWKKVFYDDVASLHTNPEQKHALKTKENFSATNPDFNNAVIHVNVAAGAQRPFLAAAGAATGAWMKQNDFANHLEKAPDGTLLGRAQDAQDAAKQHWTQKLDDARAKLDSVKVLPERQGQKDALLAIVDKQRASVEKFGFPAANSDSAILFHIDDSKGVPIGDRSNLLAPKLHLASDESLKVDSKIP